MHKKRIHTVVLSTILFSYIFLLQSCLKDIPTKSFNDPRIVFPPIYNSILNDSLSSLINYPNPFLKGINRPIVTREIINSKYHLAFTDLIKYNDIWYIAFRFSDEHVATNFGHIIIAKSENLETWKSEQIYMQNGYDLRDPKFLIKDSVLCIHFHSTTIKPYGESRNDYIAKYNPKNDKWGNAIKINKNTNKKSWFWRLTEHNNKIYTIAYRVGEPLRLFTSNNGTDFKELSIFTDIQGRPSEATLRFSNDVVYALIRREEGGALLARSSVLDMTAWTFIDLPWEKMGGPNFLIYENKLLITGRVNGLAKLFSYSLDANTLKEIATFPGGIKEMGYCGMYIEDEFLYISYYTGNNNGGFCLKISRINLKELSAQL